MPRIVILNLVLLFAFFHPAASQQIATYYVDQAGSDTDGDGSAQKPWASLQGATAALPDSGGDVVIADGIYGGTLDISRRFTGRAVFRAAHPYHVILEADQYAIRVDGGAGIEFSGMEMRHTGPENADAFIVAIRNSSNVILRDNIIHDSFHDNLVKVSYSSSDILLMGNVFYNQGSMGGHHVEINGSVDVVVRENIFFNDFSGSGRANTQDTGSYIVLRNSEAVPESRRIRIADNILFHWQGAPDQSFIMVGEDGLPFHEAQEVVIENNLMAGDSAESMYAPLTVQGARDISFRNQTVTGPLPSQAFGMRLSRTGQNPQNQNLLFANNIWSDPTGSMNALSDGQAADSADLLLTTNLYWNGTQSVPVTDGVLDYTSDRHGIVADPVLPVAGVAVLPRWNGAGFLSGASSIRAEFMRLVELYGTPDALSPVVGQAIGAASPMDDILNRPRVAPQDIGARQLSAQAASFRMMVLPAEKVGGARMPLNQVLLDEAAGGDGVTVLLESSNPAAAAVPDSVRVPPGSTAASFEITTSAVPSPITVTITARLAAEAVTAPLTLSPQRLRTVNLGPEVLTGGVLSDRNLVLLDGAAPAEGVQITLTSSRPDVASVQEQVTAAAGHDFSGFFSISTKPVAHTTPVTITASQGSSTISSVLTLVPPSDAAGSGAGATGGQITLVGATSTQALLSYTVSDASVSCNLKVSENQDFGQGYRPVHDVDPALFPDADRDSRPGTVVNGNVRTVVIGKRTVETGVDGRKYSRALQVNTIHYVRIVCNSGATYSRTFSTSNIPFGNTYPEPLPTDPASQAGLYNYPSLNWSDRNEKIIDSLTGAEIRKVTLPNDFAETTANRSVAACTGAHWSAPGNCQAADGHLATYTGTTQDVLYAPAAFSSPNGATIVDRMNVSLQAGISGNPSGDDKYLDVCMTKDGTTCVTPWKAVDLTTCSLTGYQGDCSGLGSTEEMDFWGAETPFQGWVKSSTEGFLLKPRTISPSYTIAIDHIKFTVKAVSAGVSFPAHAGQPLCSFVPVTDNGDGNTYYLCFTQGSRRFYSIDVTNGKAYYLGPIILQTPLRTVPDVVFDQHDPRVFYAVQPVENYLLKGTWSAQPGTMTREHTGDFLTQPASLKWTTLTPAGYTLKDLLARFDSRFDAEWLSKVNGSMFVPVAIQHNKVVLQIQTAQDRGGWLVVFDPAAPPPAGSSGQGNVVAAYYVGMTGPSRFCTLHTALGDYSDKPWALIGNGRAAKGTGYFAGPWQVKVRKPGGGALSATDTKLELVRFNNSYEPTDPTPSGGVNDLTIPAQPGDLFAYDKNGDGYYNPADEFIEVVSINRSVTPPQWTVRRGDRLDNSPFLLDSGFSSVYTKTFTLPEGAVLDAVCRAQPLNRNGDTGSTLWNFEADPHGSTLVYPGTNGVGTFPPAAGMYAANSGYASPQLYAHWNTGAHGHLMISQGLKIAFSGVPDCENFYGKNACWATQTGSDINLIFKPVSFQAAVIPPFAGALPPGAVNTYQSHPGFLQVNAPPEEKRWAFDVLPLSYGTGAYGSTGSPEPGTTHVYEVKGTTLHRKQLGTLATCGEHALSDISSSAVGDLITDEKPYTYCVANADNECRSGSKARNVYVSCPSKTQNSCASSPFVDTYPTTVVDVCVGDSWSFGHGIVQVPVSADSKAGEHTRVVSYPFPIPHLQGIYSSAKATPDGKWALFLGQRHERPDVFLIKLPPYPEPDGKDRSTFQTLSVPVPKSSHSGVNNAIVEFGYTEFGAPTDFFCTTRKEACVAGVRPETSALPYVFSSELPPGVACAAGCTVDVPALPQHVVYYRVKYRGADGSVLSTGALQTAVAP